METNKCDAEDQLVMVEKLRENTLISLIKYHIVSQAPTFSFWCFESACVFAYSTSGFSYLMSTFGQIVFVFGDFVSFFKLFLCCMFLPFCVGLKLYCVYWSFSASFGYFPTSSP